MTRWKASLIHLGLSAIVYVPLLYLIVFQWYPQPYFAVDGGWQGLRLISGVDLVLGPLLTLIVFKSGKPGLRRDLTLIGLLQVFALTWGISLVYEQRTAMVTFADGGFHTINIEQVYKAGGQAPTIAEQSSSTPPYAFVRMPVDRRERQDVRLKALFSGTTTHLLGERYEMLGEKNLKEVLKSGVHIGIYPAVSEQNRENLERFLARHGGSTQDYAFFPLFCRYQTLMLALRRTDGSVVDTLEINPEKTAIPETATVNKLPAK
jgi:hypothetical protein